MEYAEYFSNLYEKYKDTSKDAVEDKKHFKYDFYNLVLDSLQIKEDYEKHFTSDHILSDDDISFLDEFSTFIFADSLPENTKPKPEALSRGIGQKQERSNGRRIIKHQYNFFSRELFSIFESFNSALANDKESTFLLDTNPIAGEITKVISKEYISSISKKLIKSIDSLPSPYFSYFISKLRTDITTFFKSCTTILETLEACSKLNLMFLPHDLASNDKELQKRTQNNIINAMIEKGTISLSQNEKNILHNLSLMKKKSTYRNTKKEIDKLKTKFEDSIYNSNKDLFDQLKLNRSDFHFFEDEKEKLENQYHQVELYYNEITNDISDQVIKFHKG